MVAGALFDKDIPPPGFNGGHASAAAACEEVTDNRARPGMCSDHPFQQINGLLRWVDGMPARRFIRQPNIAVVRVKVVDKAGIVCRLDLFFVLFHKPGLFFQQAVEVSVASQLSSSNFATMSR